MSSEPPHPKGQSHAKALWALGWRALVLTPVVAVVGLLALSAVLALDYLLPLLAVVLVLEGFYLWAVAALAVWVVWLRFGGRLRRWVFEGFKHGSL